MEHIRINSQNTKTKIYINDKEITGVRGYRIKHNKSKVPTILIEMCLNDYDVDLYRCRIKKEPLFYRIAHRIRSKFIF